MTISLFLHLTPPQQITKQKPIYIQTHFFSSSIIIHLPNTMCNPNATPTSITTTTAAAKPPPSPLKTSTFPDHYNYLHLLSQPTNQKAPSLSDLTSEAKSLFNLAFPIALTALILYSRSIVSMVFLGHLGDLELAAGSLAIAFANITGYSVLSGLSLGMEPICSQAFGAQRPKLLSLTLHRSVIFLIFCSLPISFLWINVSTILIFLGQDPKLASLAQTYLLCSLPELLTSSFIHPIRIYLRAQGITQPLTLSSFSAAILHLPISFLLVNRLNLGVAGVAAASAASNCIFLLSLLSYVWTSRGFLQEQPKLIDCFSDWKPLIKLAAPSCVSVCLEWWWYEIMILMCGLLAEPRATVASMGILIQTTSLIYVFPSSLGFAVSARVGNELGAGRPNRAKLSAEVAVVMASVMGLTASTFASGMRRTWGRMFTNDAEILRLTSLALPILGLCELGNCPQTVGCGVLRGSARPSNAANVNLGAFYLVGLPVAVGLSFWAGVGFCGLWIGLLSAQICCAGLMLYVVGNTDWVVQARRAEMLTCNSEEEEDDDDGDGQPLMIITQVV